MSQTMNFSHASHSGRLRPHEHTSYIPLFILLFIVGIVLTSYSVFAQSPGPASSSVSLTGAVPGSAPTVAATIASPGDQARFPTSPVTVSGACPADTLVELFKNDIFAGSIPCSSTGTYTTDVDLLIGQNTIVARVYDSLNQAGPDSNAITIFYDALPAQSDPLTSLSFGGSQLLLNTDAVFRGAFPEQELTVPINIIGGTAPYAVNIQWGDSNNKVIPRNDNLSFASSHAYSRPGTYQISLQATDANGRVGFLSVAAIVNGQPATTAVTGSTTSPTIITTLLALWPLYTAVAGIVIAFWLGERRVKKLSRSSPPTVYHQPQNT